mmetsp:Transcript_66754/g.217311  ORF Transcript_66754/g.217311 Transcript_66754/m.217311 type:complete len:874 (+) Transcript_66754:116-2737(+)
MEGEADGARGINMEMMQDTFVLATTLKLPDEAPEISMDGDTAGMLFVKIGLLEQDMERFAEGMQGLVGEAEGIIGGMFERMSILHARTARIEMMLGLPVFGEEDDEESCPNSPRPGGMPGSRPGSPFVGRDSGMGRGMPEGAGGRGRCCRRGHPLRQEEVSEDDPPRVCGFCRRSRPASHVCSEGCYFTACAECCAEKEQEEEGTEAPEDGPRFEELTEEEAELMRRHCAAERAAMEAASAEMGAERADSEGRAPSEEDGPAAALRRSWPAGPASIDGCEEHSESRPSASVSGRATPVQEKDPSVRACRAGARSGNASVRQPETPSTDIPGDEPTATSPSPRAVDEIPLPPGGEDYSGRRGRGGASGERGDVGGITMKVRLAALESEVRELERRLSEAPPSMGDTSNRCPVSASAASVADLEHIVEQMLGDESARIREVLQQQVDRVAAESAANLAAAGPSLRRECKASANRAGEALRCELMAKIDEVLSQVQTQHVTFSSAFEAALKKDVRAEFSSALHGLSEALHGELKAVSREASSVHTFGDALKDEFRESMSKLAHASQLELEGKIEDLSADLRANVQVLATRMAGLEGDIPRGRARPVLPRPPSPSTSRVDLGGEAGGGEVVEGLAQGVTVMARAMGLMAESEMLGDSAEGWSGIGRRFEKAWAVRVRDFWYGHPSQPHLFDLLRARPSATGAGAPSTMPPSPAASGTPPLPLPDRREGARLATRLAAAVAFGTSMGSTTDDCRSSEDDVGLQPSMIRRACSSSGMMSPDMDSPVRSSRKEHTATRDAWGQDPFNMSQSSGISAAETCGRPPTPQRSREPGTPHRSSREPSTPHRSSREPTPQRSSRGEPPPLGIRRQSSATTAGCRR